MASDAPLIGLNAPLKNHYLALEIFGALFIFFYLCCNKRCPTEKSPCPKNYEI